MARNAADVIRLLRQRSYKCPLCAGQRWQAIAEPALVDNLHSVGQRTLLTAVCRSCGYVIAMQQDVPERYEEVS